jgi:membrane associated rhomboid family serine protease
VLLEPATDLDQALERSLVLDAVGLAHALEPAADGRWALRVADEDAPAAEAALAAWAAESARREPPPDPDYGPSRVPAGAALALLAFTAFALRDPATAWVERGGADAARIVRGEWWRAATALTLHADAGHAAGNAIALGLLLWALARRLGPAPATWLALAAGIAGNAATALLVRGGHLSVGASTAVFGALGALSALHAPRRRAWLALASGVALLGLLGTGERSDLFAHLLGFVAGVVQGLALRRAAPPRRSAAQPVLALAAAVLLALAWWRALG